MTSLRGRKLWNTVKNVRHVVEATKGDTPDIKRDKSPSTGRALFNKLRNTVAAEEHDDTVDDAQTTPSTEPSGMDMMMEQLSAMSQRLANTRMEQASMVDQKRKAKADKELLMQQVEELQIERNAAEKSLAQVKQKLGFEKVEETTLELKRLIEENQTLIADLNELTQTQTKMTQEIEDAKKQRKELAFSKEETERVSASLASQLEEGRNQGIEQKSQLHAATDRIAELEKIVSDLEVKLDNSVSDTHIKGEAKLKDVKEKCSERLQAAQNEMQEELARRADPSKQIVSMKTELKKLLKERADYIEQDRLLTEENTRMNEDLQRKCRSLKDCLEALHLSQDFAGVDPRLVQPPAPTNIIALDTKKLKNTVTGAASRAADASQTATASTKGKFRKFSQHMRNNFSPKKLAMIGRSKGRRSKRDSFTPYDNPNQPGLTPENSLSLSVDMNEYIEQVAIGSIARNHDADLQLP